MLCWVIFFFFLAERIEFELLTKPAGAGFPFVLKDKVLLLLS